MLFILLDDQGKRPVLFHSPTPVVQTSGQVQRLVKGLLGNDPDVPLGQRRVRRTQHRTSPSVHEPGEKGHVEQRLVMDHLGSGQVSGDSPGLA